MGSTQALCRSLYARLIPVDRTSEFFGFNVFVGRASAALGPLIYGLVTAATGSHRVAMATLGLSLLAGGVVLSFVKAEKSHRAQMAENPVS